MAIRTDQAETMRQHAIEIFQAALGAVDPVAAVLRYVKPTDNGFQIGEHRFKYQDYDRILVWGPAKPVPPWPKPWRTYWAIGSRKV